MPTNRNFYQVHAMYVGPSPSSGSHYSSGNSGDNLITQLHRVQTYGHNASIARQDINQFGQLERIGAEIIDQPEVSANFSYYLTNVLNEQRIGLTPVDGSANFISGILNASDSEKNYFVSVVDEGNNAVNYDPANGVNGVIAIGNGFINSYAFDAAVGGLANVSVGVEGLNLRYYTGYSGQIPAINPEDGIEVTGNNFQIPQAVSGVAGQETALRYGDITVDITNDFLGVDISDAKIQSVNLSAQLSRTPQNKLGSRFAVNRPIQFPVPVNLSFDAEVGDLVTGSLADILCNDQDYTISVTLRRPDCANQGDVAAKYTVKGLKLDTADYNASIGPNDTVSFGFSTQLGGPNQDNVGVFLSGSLA